MFDVWKQYSWQNPEILWGKSLLYSGCAMKWHSWPWPPWPQQGFPNPNITHPGKLTCWTSKKRHSIEEEQKTCEPNLDFGIPHCYLIFREVYKLLQMQKNPSRCLLFFSLRLRPVTPCASLPLVWAWPKAFTRWFFFLGWLVFFGSLFFGPYKWPKKNG